MADNEIIKYRGTNVAGPVVPFTSADGYPTHYAEFGKGGFRSVNFYEDLAKISPDRREDGMLVYCLETKYAYQWLNDTWVKSKIGGGVEKIEGSIDSINIENNSELFEEGNIVYSEEDKQYYYYLIDSIDEETGESIGTWYPWGQIIHVGNNEPVTLMPEKPLWIDTSNGDQYIQGSSILTSIQTAIVELQEKVGLLMNIRTSGVIPGDISEGTRTEIINSANPEKPRAKIEAEAEEFDKESFPEWFSGIEFPSDLLEIYLPVQSYLELQLEVYKNESLSQEERTLAYETIIETFELVVEESEKNQQDIEEIVPGLLVKINECYSPDEAIKFSDDLLYPVIYILQKLVDPAFDQTTTEIEPDKDIEPTVKHISIKMGTWDQLEGNIKNYIPGELMWCTDRAKLYIYVNGRLIAISGSGGNGDDDDMTEQQVKTIIQNELQNVESIGFIPVGSDSPLYTVRVNEYGNLIVYDKSLDNMSPMRDGEYFADSVNEAGIHINSFYLGGDYDEHSYLPCSHNFVELSNVWVGKNGKGQDINLNGYYLCYYDGSRWYYLKLWGVIPAGSTFLIRGAQCSVMDVNTTKIKVKTFDMEWYTTETIIDPVTNESVTTTKLIQFNQNQSVFYLVRPSAYEKNAQGNFIYESPIFKYFTKDKNDSWVIASATTLPVIADPTNATVSLCTRESDLDGYIDLTSYNYPPFSENKTYTLQSGKDVKDVMFRRWYQLDPVSQSNPKGIAKHNTLKYLTVLYLNGENIDSNISIEEFTPRASYEGKTIAAGRTLFSEEYPSTLTCTFGCQATDNTVAGRSWEETEPIATPTVTVDTNILPDTDDYEIGNTVKLSNNKYYKLKKSTPEGIGATRCFCWNSVGYYDEGIKLRKKISQEPGEDPIFTDWTSIESINRVFGKDYVVVENPNDSNPYINLNADYSDINDELGQVEGKTQITKEGFIKYYSRVRWESAYGQAITTHRVIIRGLLAGDYEYCVYRVGDDTYTNKDGRNRKFSIRTDKDVVKNGFNFVQTTDQQGANWEEYEVWNLSAKVIKRENDRWYKEGWDNIPKLNTLPSGDDLDNYTEAGTKIKVAGNYYELKIEGDNKTWIFTSPPIPDYDFTINTGDICYNGSRSNEWIDYYVGYEPLDDKVEMLTIGNNDLSPITMRDIGNGDEAPWKIGVDVIDYFYTYEIDPINPQVFTGNSYENPSVHKTYKMPSLYSFNYGDYHFMSLLSEIRTIKNKNDEVKTNEDGTTTPKTYEITQSTVTHIFGVVDVLRSPTATGASKIFDIEEEWVIKDLIKWKNNNTLPTKESNNYWTAPVNSANDWAWAHRDEERYNDLIVGKCRKCIIFTHEMPFNIISDGSYVQYMGTGTNPRETAKAYLNRYHNYEYQRLFKLWGIPMIMGGHKHTAAITLPVYDAISGYNPISKNINSTETATRDTIMTNNSNDNFPAGDSFNPFIQVTLDIFKKLWNNNKYDIKDFGMEIYNNSTRTVYFDSQFDVIDSSTGAKVTLLPGNYINRTTEYGLPDESNIGRPDINKKNRPKVRIELVDKVTAPSYVMCQATGFKNKSNSDLASTGVASQGGWQEEDNPSWKPGGYIPWERFYVPDDSIKAQSYSFYSLYKITKESDNEQIESYMYYISGMYDAPKHKGSTAGYWDLARYYTSGKDLETDRAIRLNNCVPLIYNADSYYGQGTKILI